MSGSAKQEPMPRGARCELWILNMLVFARSSVARVRRLFFLLTMTYIDVGQPENGLSPVADPKSFYTGQSFNDVLGYRGAQCPLVRLSFLLFVRAVLPESAQGASSGERL